VDGQFPSTDGPTETERIRSFFDRFDSAFATFDGAEIAARYEAPYLACRADGSAQSFPDAASIAAYFQHVVDGYRRRGVRSCTHAPPTFQVLGGRHLVATVTWHLWDGEVAQVTAWTESYVLVDDGSDLRIRSSVDHLD
jgi:hypothetical protein